MFCERQLGDRYIKKTRILVTRKGTRSIVGRVRLSTFRYKFEPAIECETEVTSIEKDKELCEETKIFSNECKKLFNRNGKVKNHQVKRNLKKDARIDLQVEFQFNCKMP